MNCKLRGGYEYSDHKGSRRGLNPESDAEAGATENNQMITSIVRLVNLLLNNRTRKVTVAVALGLFGAWALYSVTRSSPTTSVTLQKDGTVVVEIHP